MRIQCTIELEFRDEDTARNVLGAVRPDDEGYIESRVEGNRLVAVAESDSILGLRNTVDDYLACVSLAEKGNSFGDAE
jgi:tRNA threonylcarbamoyladenosine modification (KEOPS) complex  Pcc1 subunit